MVDGLVMSDDEAIRSVIAGFFENLLRDDVIWDQQSVDFALEVIPNLVFEDINKEIVVIPSSNEIKKVVLSFEGNKAPGLNGFPLLFFQSCWDIVALYGINATKEFFGCQRFLKELNATFIILIPKSVDANSFGDFRLISLCNSIYKIFSKVLAARIQRILLDLISKLQSGFVRGCSILDSIITVHEVTHYLASNKKSGFFLKLDLLKAYDQVN